MDDFGQVITGFGQAFQDLFGSEGASAEASSFTSAATLEGQNAQLEAASTRIQETQMARQVYQSIGTQETDVAGAGFTESGSALDLLASSASQGALAKSLINIQGAISENSYAAQQGAYLGAAKSANENANAGLVGAIGSIGGALTNSGTLASAGQTVVSGANYVDQAFGGTAPTTAFGAPSATSYSASVVGTEGTALPSGAEGALVSPDVLLSQTDSAVAEGANLGDTVAASDIGLDTSSIPLGTDLTYVSQGLSDAALSVGTDEAAAVAADAATSAGVDAATGAAADVAAAAVTDVGADAAAAAAADAATAAAADVGADVAGAAAADSALDFLPAFLLSVICTAFYHQGIINRRLWLANQRFGRALDPVIFQGYLVWASPIAHKIRESKRFANFMSLLLRPATVAMAEAMGEANEASSFYGRTVLSVCLGFSWIVGNIVKVFKKDYLCLR